LKINYRPFNFRINNTISSTGLYLGVYSSKTFGSNYWITLPEKYTPGYYYWSPGLRTGMYFGTSLSKFVCEESNISAELFFECGSYDLLIISYWPNKSTIPLKDILKLALGVKINL
jgi:hypothetical protein